MKLDDLKKKAEKKRNTSLAKTTEKLRIKAKKLAERDRNEVLNHVQKIAKGIDALAENTVVDYLKTQEKKEEGLSVDIRKSIERLISLELDRVQPATEKEVEGIIKNAVLEVQNIFIDEESNSGQIFKDSQGRLSSVEEQFDSFKLVTKFTRKSNGGFSWTTEKIDG